MSSCMRSAGGMLIVAIALAGSACGRYGPPVRASERATPPAQEELGGLESELDPAADDPVAPGQEP